MSKHIIAIASLIVVVIGNYYYHSEGLVISIENGERMYSNSLMSSGGDDGFIISISLMFFVCTFVTSLFSYNKLVSERVLAGIYSANLLFLVFSAFLVNLDVSIYDSMKYGDFLLLSGFLASIVPLVHVAKNAIQRFAKR